METLSLLGAAVAFFAVGLVLCFMKMFELKQAAQF
jgi:hypothetical protein